MINIHIKLFAILRDQAGVAEITLPLPEGTNAAAAGRALVEKFPPLAQQMNFVAYAVNRSYAGPAQVLKDGDELALIPPVSGG